ncbi:cyclin-like protein [Metschnikowia bicuspidata var. bicuspidata NRRL YB-4993]|uniref:Cyclin-like protein n=1 Tax=Metschnikowia bicuspidata var. bicuspidata NRRL YB-4993 TaxID=869754 RepID=A0A1A0HCT4_9ASCO|nr:cyclin-like protein [Metschnikowia bicuspidata var. bicuspidata NRRL YB-4993]OBA21816.1 cyclin-like protein [Metschnikowia bicuspidata var. bicuspidata NRRL YB-4993]
MAQKNPARASHNTWLFSEDAFLRRCPSRKQMTVPQDLKARELIYAFLLKMGSELKLDGRTILAATIYINRFYMRMPITTSKYFVACAAVAISCKLHDTYRPPDKIALTACILKNPGKKIDQHSSVFWQWRDQLLYREELILKLLNFELDVELPYDFIDDLLQDKDELLKEGFYVKLPEILKYTVSKVELVSALPLLVCYDTRTLFGTMLVLAVNEAQGRFEDIGPLKVPSEYLQNRLHTSAAECYKCFQYILKLKAICEDPKLPSHSNVINRIPFMDEALFFSTAGSRDGPKNPAPP